MASLLALDVRRDDGEEGEEGEAAGDNDELRCGTARPPSKA